MSPRAISPFNNPAVLEEYAALSRRALARRAERLALEATDNPEPVDADHTTREAS